MAEISKIRERWYAMQIACAMQTHPHPNFSDGPLVDPAKLPAKTEREWQLLVLWTYREVEEMINHLRSTDHSDSARQAWDDWQKVKVTTFGIVEAFRKDRDELVAQGHFDDRHIDPTIVTDEELAKESEALNDKMAELEAKLGAGGNEDDLRAEFAALKAQLKDIKERGAIAAAKQLLAEEIPVGLTDTLDALRADFDKRCVPGITEKIAAIETNVDASAEMLEEHLLQSKLSSGGGQGGPFAHAAGGVGAAGMGWLMWFSLVAAAVLGGWLVSTV